MLIAPNAPEGAHGTPVSANRTHRRDSIDPVSMSPVAIDTELNTLGHQRAQLEAHCDNFRAAAARARSAATPNHVRADRLDAEADGYAPQIAEIVAAMAPLEDEFTRRGGWSRAFLVTNTGGHVHSSMSCSTCYPSTRYVWLTDYSGKSEDEIVFAAGELACTVCYPGAPVSSLRRQGEIRRPSDGEREQRAAAKAQRAAAKAADAVIDPNTGVVKFKTERAATNAIAAAFADLLWYGPEHPAAAEWTATAESTAAALAAKSGLDKDETLAHYRAVAEKRFAATARKAIRDITASSQRVEIQTLVPGLRAWVEQNGMPLK